MKITVETSPKEMADLALQSQPGRYKVVREPYSDELTVVDTMTGKIINPRTVWRKFIPCGDEKMVQQLESVIKEKGITQRDLALVLFSLRVSPEFEPQDFGI